MYNHGNLQAHVKRWKQSYSALTASGNTPLPDAVQVNMCCRSLHDGYSAYKAAIQDHKN